MAQASVEQHQIEDTNDFADSTSSAAKSKAHSRYKESFASSPSFKRRCVSSACIACRKRKSKCDGNIPSCAACLSVYGTECIYDPNSDHRRKGVYKQDIDNLKTRNTTLDTLIHAIQNFPDEEVPELVRQIRNCDNLDDVADSIQSRTNASAREKFDSDSQIAENDSPSETPQFETELSGKMGELRLENGSSSFIGGTSNLLFLGPGFDQEDPQVLVLAEDAMKYSKLDDAIVSWTQVTSDPSLVVHLINMYFSWHYTFFTTLSKSLFYRDFLSGKPTQGIKRNEYCSSLLVNAILALGCHFTSWGAARTDPHNPATAGDHFFKEAKRLILENDEHENPRLTTVQALALMSVREAGCGREAKGWVYSGMSFRMAYDLGLNVDSASSTRDEQETDARRITVWGCFLFDKCWSNYLGRQPQLPLSSMGVPKFDVFPIEEADMWSPYTDFGPDEAHSQPSRTRAVALQISALCEISCDLLSFFYNPTRGEKPASKQAELAKLSDLHTRLEAWRKSLPKEMEPREGQLPNVLVMHMFFQLLFIHLFRPFLKYARAKSSLPAHVSPRKHCTQSATMISKLLRIYKKTYGLKQVCNIVVYIVHSACTIHLLNLPDKNSIRDIVHGVKELEEIGESWLCARKTLAILSMVSRKWKTGLPVEVRNVFLQNDAKFSLYRHDQESVKLETPSPPLAPLVPQVSVASVVNHSTEMLKNEYFHSGHPAVTPPHTTEATAVDDVLSFASLVDPVHHPTHDQYVISQDQQNPWNLERMSQMPQSQRQTSPTTLFGGAESLVAESQGWWFRDPSFFENWYGLDQAAMITGNGVLHDPILVNRGIDSHDSNIGSSGPGRPTY